MKIDRFDWLLSTDSALQLFDSLSIDSIDKVDKESVSSTVDAVTESLAGEGLVSSRLNRFERSSFPKCSNKEQSTTLTGLRLATSMDAIIEMFIRVVSLLWTMKSTLQLTQSLSCHRTRRL